MREDRVWSSGSGEDGGIGRGREGPFGAMLNNLTATALGGKNTNLLFPSNYELAAGALLPET